jgi:hypothetical protein
MCVREGRVSKLEVDMTCLDKRCEVLRSFDGVEAGSMAWGRASAISGHFEERWRVGEATTTPLIARSCHFP